MNTTKYLTKLRDRIQQLSRTIHASIKKRGSHLQLSVPQIHRPFHKKATGTARNIKLRLSVIQRGKEDSKKHFPQISQIITAAFTFPLLALEKAVLLIAIIAFFLNAAAIILYPPDDIQKIRQAIMREPFVSRLHEKLAYMILSKNAAAARNEFFLAEQLQTAEEKRSAEILGIATSPASLWQNIQNTQETIKNQTMAWEKLHQLFPEYQYAQIKMAAFYYELGDREKARQILSEVFKDNPGSPLAKQLEGQLK